ncbi:MAG: DUF262 domain-containing protein [Planctomycetes bacterium]|nr:DUF262 domain-containing protein [Planctomycetota bacterium]
MSAPDNIRHYFIPDIGNWQLAASENEVSLPALQRGFVWNAGRIESLWDSLLRGFPIGSFLLASNRSRKYQLLDGQQRSTAIAIGMYNPWRNPETHFWRIQNCPVLWLDINSESREHRFKITSAAHPWGYDKQSERLNATERKRAYDAIFQPQIAKGFSKKYYELPLSEGWPWVASAPFPFSFFFEPDVDLSDPACAKEAMLKKCVERLKHISGLASRKSANDYRKAVNLFWTKDNVASSQLIEHLCRLKRSAVPAIVISEDTLSSTGLTTNWGDDTPDESLEEKEGLELIFERINSGGVVLGPEELVYSIFKSLLPAASEIEEKCDYIKPAKVMNYAVRLVMASNRRSSSVFPKRVKIREFKEWLEKDDNQNEVAQLIGSLDKPDSPFRLARNILTGEPGARQPWQLSFYQTSAIANESPDPFFLLLFRLRKGDRFESASLQRKALGFVTSLCWFVERSGRGTAKACERIWQHRSDPQESFWSGETLKSAVKYELHDQAFLLMPPCPPSDLEKLLSKLRNDRLNWGDQWDGATVREFFKSQRFHRFYGQYFDDGTDFEGDGEDDDITPATIPKLAMVGFVDQLRNSDGLLAYACRAAICDWFDDYFRISLEDTDRPWDRDHIYPMELTKSKRARGKSETESLYRVKDWQSTVANMRLWPLELNRSDSNQLPSYKFDYLNNKESLQSHGIQAREDLFRRSAIDPAESQLWLDLGDNPKDKAQAQDILNAFLKRLTFMYRDWYESLGIAELFPSGHLR